MNLASFPAVPALPVGNPSAKELLHIRRYAKRRKLSMRFLVGQWRLKQEVMRWHRQYP